MIKTTEAAMNTTTCSQGGASAKASTHAISAPNAGQMHMSAGVIASMTDSIIVSEIQKITSEFTTKSPFLCKYLLHQKFNGTLKSPVEDINMLFYNPQPFSEPEHIPDKMADKTNRKNRAYSVPANTPDFSCFQKAHKHNNLVHGQRCSAGTAYSE